MVAVRGLGRRRRPGIESGARLAPGDGRLQPVFAQRSPLSRSLACRTGAHSWRTGAGCNQRGARPARTFRWLAQRCIDRLAGLGARQVGIAAPVVHARFARSCRSGRLPQRRRRSTGGLCTLCCAGFRRQRSAAACVHAMAGSAQLVRCAARGARARHEDRFDRRSGGGLRPQRRRSRCSSRHRAARPGTGRAAGCLQCRWSALGHRCVLAHRAAAQRLRAVYRAAARGAARPRRHPHRSHPGPDAAMGGARWRQLQRRCVSGLPVARSAQPARAGIVAAPGDRHRRGSGRGAAGYPRRTLAAWGDGHRCVDVHAQR